MYVLGFVVLAFLVLHMIQFWYKMQFKELLGMEGAISKGSVLVIPLFKQLPYVIIYLVAFVALWFHLTHGFWSAFHTVGWNNTVWMKRLKAISYVVATIFIAGYAVIPVYIYFFVPSPF